MVCIVEDCNCFAEDREYFFEDEPLCDKHYAGYLEKVLDSFKVEISEERADSCFEKYQIELKPSPTPAKPEPKQKPSTDFKKKM